jgi:glycosyltransferase involved in cell wall biosynthesis
MGTLCTDRAASLPNPDLSFYNQSSDFLTEGLISSMKILILSASLPYPPTSGGAIRTWGIIQGLAQQGNQITLLSFGEQLETSNPLTAVCEQIITVPVPVRSKAQRIRQLLFSAQPDIATRLYSKAFADTLRKQLEENTFDLIQFEGIEIACYLPLVKQMHISAKICFDTFNAEAELQRVIYEIDRRDPRRVVAALYSLIQSKRIKQYEGMLCRMADLVLAVSDEDAAFLSEYQPTNPVRVVSSGIYVDNYQHSANPKTHTIPQLIFTGKMDYRPNVDAMLWFTQKILPHLPATHLTIVGQQPHARIQHLAQQPNITITGWVDTVLPYLQDADVYIAPLRMGSGTRLKLLEALAAGCAIVATSIAAAGLTAEVREAMIIADSEGAFCEAIQVLLKDSQHRQELAHKGQHAVKQHYDWSVLIPKLSATYREIGLG